MKLRTRLFLWIGLLFFFFAALSYFLENYLVHKNLSQVKKSIKKEIQQKEEEKRAHFEDLSRNVLGGIQTQIDALLFHIKSHDFLQKRFLFSKPFGSWAALAKLLLENKQIGFIQNYQNQTTSIAIPSSVDLKRCKKKTINKDLAWIFVPNEKPVIAIHFSAQENQKYFQALSQIDLYMQTDEYFFYDPQTLLNMHFQEKDLSFFSSEIQSVFLPYQRLFLEKIAKAKDYLKTIDSFPLEEDFSQEEIDFGFSKEINTLVEQKVNLNHVMRQVWRLTTLLYLGLFDGSPLDPKAPLGIANIPSSSESGNLLYSRSVFSSKRIFDEQTYFSRFPGKKIPPSIAIVNYLKENKLFLSNSLQLAANSFLTIGISIEDFLQRISLAANQSALLVHDNKVFEVYSSQGRRLDQSSFYRVPLEKMQEKEGFLDIEGKKYYFLHLKPFKEVDLHFYLCDLEEKAFSFVYFIEKAVSKLVQKVSYSMRIIGLVALFIALFFLHNISKKVTRPIALLASSTQPIAKGEFDRAKLPDPKIVHSLEIQQLCNSFAQMIEQLKDKERVRSVLNKVVSKEIAEEILKGSVHLGGEEKIVTILFADIRGFTHLTEKMKPAEVIELLNTTMTYITKAIEKFNGVIDKYVGDEVMALFGAPISDENAQDKALLAAGAILENLNALNETRRQNNKPPIYVGIGIHSGLVLAGNMGAEDRLNYTVLGSEVNLAARLCAIAKEKEILATKTTLEKVKQNLKKTSLEPVTLKGFSTPIEVFRIDMIDMQFAKKFESNA